MGFELMKGSATVGESSFCTEYGYCGIRYLLVGLVCCLCVVWII